ncbi:hypothetical protein [Pseudomonas phage vB_PaeM_PS119XW]|uniref:Uncharacterized protein n=1 Tax=Pseudomonas phage vB_PaeM_PS119XW TaxID=2601632 RepID=A0A5C1K7X2_9CAUD|nr:hypothetical protein PP933_gp251 [Pseudomonas phage vB_PaeM_PS119XW]QEM41980.1 hypothetical protein [Pseudomonas phage vB_PaeM_PS119XW]
MARVKFNSLKDLIAAQGPIATVPAPKKEKKKAEPVAVPKTALPMPTVPKRVKNKKKDPVHRPAPEKEIRYAQVTDFRVKPEGQKEVSKPDQSGLSELGHFKNKLDCLGLELFGCEVRKKKEFADEFFNDATETPTQRAMIKEFQDLYDSKFRVKV